MMNKNLIKLAVIGVGLIVAIIFISNKSDNNSQREGSIFAYNSFAIFDSFQTENKKIQHRIPPKFNETYSVEDGALTEEEKKEKLEFQKGVMTSRCHRCRNIMSFKLFPESMRLEKIMGISEYPYETEIITSFDLHIKQCLRKCSTFHQYCYAKDFCAQSESGFFCDKDLHKCTFCGCNMTIELFSKTALKSLYKSTKPYEFAYIYKTLKRYNGGDISACLKQTTAPTANSQKIKAKVNKCQFKGKNSILASLDFVMLNANSNNKAAVLGRFMKHSLSDSILDGSSFWKDFVARCKDPDELRDCLMTAVDNVSEEFLEVDKSLYTELMYTCFKNFTNLEILHLITKCMLSKQYFLLSCLRKSSSAAWVSWHLSLQGAEKLPSAFRVLSFLENNISSTTDSILLDGCIDKRANAIAKYISAVPYESMPHEYTVIYIYLKRMYKTQSSKDYVHFCDSLIRHLQTDRLKSNSYSSRLTLEDGITYLKICMFYNKKYAYKMRQSSFLSCLFDYMDLDSKWESDKANIIENHISPEDCKEILALRAMNCNSRFSLEDPTELLKKKTQKSLAEKFVNNGNSLSQEGLQIVPQICKKFCKSEQYKRFLHDLCHSPVLPICAINTKVLKDLVKECKKFSRAEAGFLPLLSKCYEMLGCEKWQENEVMMWCVRNNFADWLRCHPDASYEKSRPASDYKYMLVKRHFKTILRYLLDKTGDNICVEAELVAKCWMVAYGECNNEIFSALAAAKNGYIHANIFYMLNLKGLGSDIAKEVVDKIIKNNNNVCTEEHDALEAQKKYVKFVKKWEETDIILSCTSHDMSVMIRSFVATLEELKGTEVDTLFSDFVKHASALKSLKERNGEFYITMAKSLDFIPQSAIDLYCA
ncbi:hypothetical protein ENBRE01_2524 [Enteropsectra breve]|nr:hypothetical protein ENBRE01_2524 [Enteropsectra breve]